ncbi:hypothetical protein AB1388_42085, partial [Streptomyces hydrogenans]
AADTPAPLRIEPQAAVVAAGSTGFLLATNRYRGDDQYWVRYDTGERTPIDGNQYMYPGENLVVGDNVLLCGTGAPTVRNMTTGTTVLTVPGESGRWCAGLAGGAVFLEPRSVSDPLRMYDAEHGIRTVTGIPEGSTRVTVRQGTATHALLRYRGADGVEHRGTIDFADAAVAEASEWHFEAALSDTRIAWNEYDPATKKSTVVVHTRGKAEKQIIEAARDAHVAFLGDRLVHSAPDGTQALAPSPLNRLNVVDLKTGATTRLLDHVRAVAAAPDGDLLVSGGQIGTGDGIFHVSVGADGTPTAATRPSSRRSATPTCRPRRSTSTRPTAPPSSSSSTTRA